MGSTKKLCKSVKARKRIRQGESQLDRTLHCAENYNGITGTSKIDGAEMLLDLGEFIEKKDSEDTVSVATTDTTESYNKRLQQAELMLKKDQERKKKQKLRQVKETVDEVVQEVEREIYKEGVLVDKPMETVVVEASISTKSSITNNTSEFMKKYISNCSEMGIIDTLATQEQHFKRMTRQYVWRYFKLVDEDQYIFGTNFVNFICNHCNRDVHNAETRDWWNGIKHHVQRAMMDMRSACTQAMKRSFVGKLYI
jgi:hypothetical protein